MSKYYTPEKDEFCIGFEYQMKHEGEWKNTKVPEHYIGCDLILTIPNLGHWDVPYKPRVKHLDREDIESLGFEEIGQEHYVNNNGWSIVGKVMNDNVSYRINDSDGTNLSFYKIKNKRELVKLLKQLGV